MRNLVIISLIFLLLMGACATQAKAKSKSFTIKVSCIVPERLELTNPATLPKIKQTTIEEEKISPSIIDKTSSKIETQETKTIEGQKAIVFTIVER